MEFHGRDLGHGDEALDAVDLQVGLAIALDDGLFDQRGHAGRCVALKPFLVIDAVRGAYDRTWTAPEMLDHPRSDDFEVAGEIELGGSAALAFGRP